jgi:hypothetical protein
LQLLLQFNYEIVNKENFRIMSEIIEFLSLHYKTCEPADPSFFLLITKMIQEILLGYMEELGHSNRNPSFTLRLDRVQQSQFFIKSMLEGGMDWQVHPYFKSFMEKFIQKTDLVNLVNQKFRQLRK